MSDTQIFDPEGRAIPFAVEGDGPVSLVLIPERGLEGNPLGVVAHYLAEEAGFHIVRIGVEPSAPDAVDATLSVIDHVGLERTWIGGHGAGGTLARRIAAAHADRLNGLLLLGVEDVDLALAPVIPVLIIQGADDEVTPPAAGEALQATAPERASVKTLPGTGHLFPMMEPVETAVIIEEYLDWD